jgi:hypothetical protein
MILPLLIRNGFLTIPTVLPEIYLLLLAFHLTNKNAYLNKVGVLCSKMTGEEELKKQLNKI